MCCHRWHSKQASKEQLQVPVTFISHVVNCSYVRVRWTLYIVLCMALGQSDQQMAWMCAVSAELDLFGESHATEMTDEQVVQQLPEELRRQSLSGTLPVSLNTLRVSL